MGNYNPDAPFVLGNEFSGIKDFDIEFDYNNNAAEYGVSFTLPTSTTIQDARVYTHPLDLSDNALNAQIGQITAPLQVNIYPAGAQYDTGPIRRVVIPVTGGQVSGFGNTGAAGSISTPSGSIAIPGTVPTNDQIASALFDVNTGISYFVPPSVNGSTFFSLSANLFFGVDQYAQQLQGKRILEVNLLYRLLSGTTGVDAFSTQTFCNILIQMTIGPALGFGAGIANLPFGYAFGDNALQMQRLKIGEVTPFWTLGSGQQRESLPWTPALLQNFSPNATAATRFGLRFSRNAAGNTALYAGLNETYGLSAVALEVIYCEETRVAYGGKNSIARWPYGANVVPMRTPGTLAAAPTLPAGNYVATVIAPGFGEFNTATISADVYPPFHAIQTYYTLPTHTPIVVNRPFPLVNGVGQQFTAGTPQAVPQITLHDATGAPINASQVYGRRADVPVDTATTPVQVVDPSNSTVGAKYDQIRFYARRWGTADQPLTVTLTGGATASITAAALDALPEIVDGYREVTLPLSAAFTVTGTGSPFNIVWTSPNAVGRRYEVLGTSAPALSGIAGQSPQSYLYALPAVSQLGPATYLQPSGATDALSWMSPNVSGTALDPITDAVFLLSQSPVTIVGVAVSQQSLAVTGVNTNCGVTPEAMPTGVGFNVFSWSNPGITGSGFAYYEIQRSDAYDGTWQTIAKLPTQATTSFRDYEARVGVSSAYRIRVGNVMSFVGAWSVPVSGTVVAPGITGTNVGSGVLIFTSNANQAGVYTLAYTEALGSSPVESVTFPEASRTKLQWMYGKNDQTAFHPIERGGETFSRALLVQNASVALTSPTVQRGMQSLRDMAWASLPYVCVRNEIGDRWYANVQVSGGSFQRSRAIQLAQVVITEVTDTPAVVTGT